MEHPGGSRVLGRVKLALAPPPLVKGEAPKAKVSEGDEEVDAEPVEHLCSIGGGGVRRGQ
jgi:hypothetical protein